MACYYLDPTCHPIYLLFTYNHFYYLPFYLIFLLQIVLVINSNFFIYYFADLTIGFSYNIITKPIFNIWSNYLVCSSGIIFASFWCKKICYSHNKDFIDRMYLLAYFKHIPLSICDKYLFLLLLSFHLINILAAKL